MRSTRVSRLAVLAGVLVLFFYRPIAAQETATRDGAEAPIAVAARDLPRGAVLGPGDFVLERPAGVTDAGPVGWMTRRVVREGEPLQPPAIAPADVVRSGDPVQLVWTDGSLELRLSGKALGSAAIGETVQVRVDTQRRFQGTVLEAGIVRLDHPSSGRR